MKKLILIGNASDMMQALQDWAADVTAAINVMQPKMEEKPRYTFYSLPSCCDFDLGCIAVCDTWTGEVRYNLNKKD